MEILEFCKFMNFQLNNPHGKVSFFPFNKQIALFEAIYKDDHLVVIKDRQAGFSTCALVYAMYFATLKPSKILFVSGNNDQSKYLFNKLESLFANKYNLQKFIRDYEVLMQFAYTNKIFENKAHFISEKFDLVIMDEMYFFPNTHNEALEHIIKNAKRVILGSSVSFSGGGNILFSRIADNITLTRMDGKYTNFRLKYFSRGFEKVEKKTLFDTIRENFKDGEIGLYNSTDHCMCLVDEINTCVNTSRVQIIKKFGTCNPDCNKCVSYNELPF